MAAPHVTCELSGIELRELQERLATDRSLRERFAALYNGSAPPEINESYWCAATAFTATDFRAGTEQGGNSILGAPSSGRPLLRLV